MNIEKPRCLGYNQQNCTGFTWLFFHIVVGLAAIANMTSPKEKLCYFCSFSSYPKPSLITLFLSSSCFLSSFSNQPSPLSQLCFPLYSFFSYFNLHRAPYFFILVPTNLASFFIFLYIFSSSYIVDVVIPLVIPLSFSYPFPWFLIPFSGPHFLSSY